MKKNGDIEIMAPAGSYESLMAAIKAGADSVYFGADRLNMRSKSSNNFTVDDIRNIVKICNENNVKTYLTANVVIYNQDLSLMKELLEVAKDCGVSAVIASDMAVVSYAQQLGLTIHISTQLNVSNIEAVRFYSQFADVMVLAREVTMEQAKVIYECILKENITGPSGELVRIEMFVHGALCMAVSGKCYISLHQYGKSANKGQCLQACRRSYTVTENETGNQLEIDNEYIMSPKDVCTIGFIDTVIKAGVKVFKIEGRARPAEYVYTTVKCYKEAIKSVADGTYSEEKVNNWIEELKTVFNRGFFDGYYMGRPMWQWSKIYGSKATKKKIYIAKAQNFFTNIKVAEFLLESHDLSVGDEVIITGPTTGIIQTKIKEIRVNLKPVDKAVKGETFSIKVDDVVRRSDKMYKLVKREL